MLHDKVLHTMEFFFKMFNFIANIIRILQWISIELALALNTTPIFTRGFSNNTGSRGNFQTALILSLEVAPSGQSSLVPLLKYFSVRRLWNQKHNQYQASHSQSLHHERNKITYSARMIIFGGSGPSTLSIIARCSKFSWVWKRASPCHRFVKLNWYQYTKATLDHTLTSH